jgi:hypothetical protein
MTQPLPKHGGRADLYWLSGTHRRALFLAATTSRAVAPEVLDGVITELGVAEARALVWGRTSVGRVARAAQLGSDALPVRLYVDEVTAIGGLRLAPEVRARLALGPVGIPSDQTPATS